MNKSSIPNIFTFINLSLGVISLVSCIDGNMVGASLCIVAAAFLDRYDGRVARAMDACSILGKELDSLSDLISFGVAPAVAAWELSLSGIGFASYIILVIFPICGAFRLARYNVSEFNNVYTGVPITIAGFLIALDNLAVVKFGVHSILSIVFMLLLSYLMVSSIRVKKI